ncbi:MAG: hypothetical protein LUI60_04875 [Clostridia bacterium]|nr:hypothetical protein [Clostridia bacterium]
MKVNLPLICDTLLTALCAFIFFFTLVRYYTKNAVIALISGICGGVALGAGAFFYIRRKQRKKILFGREAEEKRKLAMHLCLLPSGEACSLLAKAAGGEVKGRRVESENIVCFAIFKAEPCDMDDILPALKRKCGGKDKVIACNYITENARKLAENCGAAVWECADIYLRLKKAEALPETYLYAEPEKIKLLKRIKLRFTRKLCLPAFWSGAALMFMSLFTFYPIYYIVSGAILLAVCAAAAIFGQPKSM